VTDFQVFPLVRLEDGNFNLPDEYLAWVWHCICREEKMQHLFYDGTVKDLQGWLNFIKTPSNLVYFAVNGAEPVHVAWLNNLGDGTAWVHHCAIGMGHIASKIEKLGALVGLEVKRVC